VTALSEGLIDRFAAASAEFERTLRKVQQRQWAWPTPCAEWNVRQLVNHMTRGNVSYLRLLRGGSAAEFARLRDADALGADSPGAYARSVLSAPRRSASPAPSGAFWITPPVLRSPARHARR
jgi:uncharacterized protein (TIGR03083 family)